MKKFWLSVCALLLVLSCLKGTFYKSHAQASSEPEPPRVFMSSAYPTTDGVILNLPAGGNLQATLNNAQPGDTIVLQAGAVYSGNFTLPAKAGSDWIVIRTSDLAGISGEGIRVSPAQHLAMPKILSPNAAPALATAAGAHHYRLVGLEIGIATGVTTNYGIVTFGDSAGQTSLDSVPHDLVIDRCYVHGNSSGDVSRALALNSAWSAVVDSYLSECHGVGFDTQAIAGWNGPGPFKIVNNYLEAAGENVMFGGADPRIANLIPSDIEFRRNYCTKPLSWNPNNSNYAGVHWSVKNSFELKNAQRVLVDGNVFEHCWVDGQTGFLIVFTPRNQDGTAPWSAVKDITFTNNLGRGAAAGIQFLGSDDIHPSQQEQRIKIKNNLFYDIGGAQWGGNGRLFQIVGGTAALHIDHNTGFQTSNIITADGAAHSEFAFTNNIAPHNEYGVIGSGHGFGNDSLSYYFPGCEFNRNVMIAGPGSRYPAANFFPSSVTDVDFVNVAAHNYRLAATSPYKRAGTDGRDLGADQDAIEAAIGGQQLPPSNQPPQVSVTATPKSGMAPLRVELSAFANDADGSVVSYNWDFGDGQRSTLPAVSHIFQTAGTRTATVTVTDNLGAIATASIVITVASSPSPLSSEIVLYASEATSRTGRWKVVLDTNAAGGSCISNPDAGAAKITTPLASPKDYFEMRFYAQATVGYRLWMRGRAQGNSPYNDSVFLQFGGSVDSRGAPVFRIGTTSATTVNLEDDLNVGISGWGWQDNGWGTEVLGPLIFFSNTGWQTVRVQVREDGLSVDQIVLSPTLYISVSPGALKNDTTMLPESSGIAAPTISLVTPSLGPTTGGSTLTIRGQRFAAGASVVVGGMTANSVNIVSSDMITATTPSHAEGEVDIVVTNLDGQSGSLVHGYTYLTPCLAPQVTMLTTVTSGSAPLGVGFTATASDDDGWITAYNWNLGDGATSTLESVSHTYRTAGTFTARVTVVDNTGAVASASVVISVLDNDGTLIRLQTPNGAETLLSGSVYLVTWSVTGNVTRQDIKLSLDGGLTWRKVATGLGPGINTYNWLVPKSSTRTARIRVRAWTDDRHFVEDMSDNDFSISTKRKR